jgi:MFS family permease/rhodanese-related sulfurtransferase
VARLTRRFHVPSALRPSPARIDPDAASRLVSEGALLLDVRRHEDEPDPLDGAVRVTPDLIPARLADFPLDAPIVLACACLREATSVRVAHWLRDRGLEAYAVQGGIAALRDPSRYRAPAEAAVDVREARGAGPLAALRHRRFRLYSAGVLFSLTGNWVEAAAFGYVVLLLGGSAATLGLIGFLNTIPNLIWGLPAGALADRYDRRRLLLVFQGANMALAVLLAVLWATDALTVPLMGAIAVVGGSLGTLSFPAFQGMLAATVPKQELESAVAINSLSLQVARFAGPALAGFLLASGGPTWVFAVNALSFLAVLGAVALLPGSKAAAAEAAANLGGAMKDGLRYVFGQRSMASLMSLTLLGGVFGTPPVAFMLPGIVRFQLDAGAATLGALTASIGLGSLLGALLLLRLARRSNKGEPALAGYFITALAVAGVGVSGAIPLSLALGVVGGFAGVVFVGLSTVVVQTMSSDEMRARAMAIWAAAFVGLLPVGALITAGLAAWLGAGGAVLVDGLVMLVGGAIVFAARPELVWLGCAALPEACVAATDPPAVALEREPELAASPDPA